MHFPETREIWSYGSGYGGNALLGKKCFALRIASNIARDEGWMAEHMLILGVEDPQGEKTYVAAAFPSACGKTNFAMLIPPEGLRGLEGVDGRRRHRLDQAGRQGPAARDQSGSRFLRRRPGHVVRTRTRTRWRRSRRIRSSPMSRLRPRAASGGKGMTDEPPAECTDWHGNRWTPDIAKETGREGRASQRAFHRAGIAMPDDRSRVGSAERRADQRDHLRRTARHDDATGLSGVQLERRRVYRRDHGIGDDGRRGGHSGQGSPRSHGDAAISAATTWAITSATGFRCSAR